MKAVKRFFGGKKKKKNSAPSVGEPESQSQVQPQSLAKPPKQNSSEENRNTEKEVGDKTKTEKPSVKSAPILVKASEAKEEATEEVVPLKSSSDSFPDSKNKNTQPAVVMDPTATDSPGSRGSQFVKGANQDLLEKDKPAASSTSTPPKMEKKMDANGTSPSPVGKKVDEVAVPKSGIDDRHSTISRAYDSIPLLEQTKLPRGGISIETEAVGRVQVSKDKE